MELKRFMVWLILLLTCLSQVCSFRILCLFTTPVTSHLRTHMAVAKGLIARGHNLTIVTAIPATVPNNTNRHINLPMAENRIKLYRYIGEKSSRWSVYYTMVHSFIGFAEWGAACIQHDMFKKFLEEDESYDLVILGYIINQSELGVAAHFKSPVVVIWVNQLLGDHLGMVGNPTETSYVPNFWTTATQPMTFLKRVENYFTNLQFVALDWFIFHYSRSLYRESFPAGKYPEFSEMLNNVSAVFYNHHFSQGIFPKVPALIEVGGIQINEKPDPLPYEILQFLDNSTDGVIYFSLGTNAATFNLGHRVQRSIYGVLSRLPQKVIWHCQPNEVPGQAPNILFSKWLPQDDILAHPKVRLFITHGGYGSVTEARHHAVPIVGIPLFGDQFKNVYQAEESGWGRAVALEEIDEKTFYEVVFDVLTNAKYKKAVKKASELFRDRPMSPMDTCMFWIEYVIRHRGAPHMQSPTVHMGIIAYYSLDVLAFILLISCVTYFSLKKFLKIVVNIVTLKHKSE